MTKRMSHPRDDDREVWLFADVHGARACRFKPNRERLHLGWVFANVRGRDIVKKGLSNGSLYEQGNVAW